MPILILPSSLSSQISSGEIIERPASVIKEILENSIDAGAKNIDIIVEKNGFQSILIRDDGCGIKKKELLLAITHHATSKINSLSDLETITTFGFRGEALASIRAISRLTIISCSRFNDIAWKIYSERFIDTDITLQPIAHPQGTTVIIENLFYNIPVRLKFIKNKKLEFVKIFQIFKKIALSHFYINFSLRHNKKLVAQYRAINNKNKKIFRLKDVLNEFNINQLIEIKSNKDNIFLFGWISYPQDFTESKNIQYCYVNNRYIYNNLFIKAIHNAYYAVVKNKNISFVLYLKIPSDNIDINIHPTKNEIKFHKPNIVYTLIYETILYNLKQFKKKYCLSNTYSKKILNTYKNQECNNLDLFRSSFLKSTPFLFKKKNIFQEKNVIEKYKHLILDTYLNEYNFSIGRLLIIVRKYYGLIYHRDNFFLISFPLAQGIIRKKKLINDIERKITPKCSLIEIKMDFTLPEYVILFSHREILSKIGFNLIFKKKYVILVSIPYFLKKNINLIISDFLKFLFFKQQISISDMINWFYINIFIDLKNWNYIDGIAVLLEIEYHYPLLLKDPPPKLLQKINIDAALCILKI